MDPLSTDILMKITALLPNIYKVVGPIWKFQVVYFLQWYLDWTIIIDVINIWTFIGITEWGVSTYLPGMSKIIPLCVTSEMNDP